MLRRSLLVLLLPLFGPLTSAQAQVQVPGPHGFSYGTTSGHTSFSRQESRAEANVLLQTLTINTTPAGANFTINNPLLGFSVIREQQSQSAADSQTTTGGGSISGTSYSVFTN
ncbi:hypothetical protein NZK33_02010 [Cyanobium sp. FGCU-6]|jgi:hypothetical protein|nr:hypothetical protein [Cyanobium sp. FGCU6]